MNEVLNENNQAENNPTLQNVKDGDQVPEYIQYRGGHTNVVVDDFGIVFGSTQRNGRHVHKPLKVATREQIENEGVENPGNTVVLPVAVELVETNNLIGFGVACETPTDDDVCGEVFKTPKAVRSHNQKHSQEGDHE